MLREDGSGVTRDIGGDGVITVSGSDHTLIASRTVANVPDDFYLSPCYPNPFNPTTTIPFGLPQAGHVRLTVFNILGQQVATLVDDDFAAGHHEVPWHGRSSSGNSVSSGVYFYRLETDTFMKTRKMLLIK